MKTLTAFRYGAALQGGLTVRSLRLLHEEGHHEIAVVTVDHTLADMVRFRTGTPVQITWGHTPTLLRDFVGYISHTQPVYDTEALGSPTERTMRIYCIGASFMMKGGGFEAHKNVGASVVVRRIAEKHRFDITHVQQHGFTWPQLAQRGLTDWQWLSDLADRCGYTFYARGTALFFHDRLFALARQRSVIPTARAHSLGGTLLKFDSDLGHATPTGGTLARRTVHGINPQTGQPFTATTATNQQKPLLGVQRLEPLFTEGATGLVLDSYGEALVRLAAADARNALAIEGRLESTGDPRILVGGAVYIDALDATQNGLWYVRKVEHLFEPQTFLTRAVVGRDAVAGVATPPPPTMSFQPRVSRLVTSKWVA